MNRVLIALFLTACRPAPVETAHSPVAAPPQGTPPQGTPPQTTPVAADPDAVTIAAAGDISPRAIAAQAATSDLLVDAGYDGVLVLGDNQYPDGLLADFQQFYDPTWGRVKAITHPAPGNHDYHDEGAAGYYAYFGEAAGDPTKGYYSYDLGQWHLIALNTNDNGCGEVACDAQSPQVKWLVADLAGHANACTLAYWHHPRFNSGARHGDSEETQALWDALYAAGADVVLNGHEHVYERFDPQTPTGQADPARGIRQFTVGTGGASPYPFGPPKANSVVRETGTFGVLELTLKPTSYQWRFVPTEGSTFTDTGSADCH